MAKNYFVGVLAGDGLGTSYSSIEQIGLPDDAQPIGRAGVKLYADINARALIIRDYVAQVIEASAPLEFYFTYSSAVSSPAARWHFSQDKHLIGTPSTQGALGSTVTLMERDGHLTVLTMAADKNYYAPARSSGMSCLYFNGTQWIYNNFHDNCFEYYDSNGLLQKQQDIRGAQTIYQYDAQNRLSQITGPSSTTYEVRRQDAGFSVFMVSQGSETCLVSYTFDANGSLLTTSSSNGYQVTYECDAQTGYLSGLQQADGTSIAFAFDATHALQAISFSTFNFQLDYSQFAASNTVNYTLGSSMKRSIVLDAAGRIAELRKEQGYFQQDSGAYDVTSYAYTPSGQVDTITFPDESQEKFVYNHPLFFLTNHTKPDGSLTNYVYQTSGKKPRLLVKNEYDAQGIPLSTRYVYDIQETADLSQYYNVLRFKISPKGEVTEYRVDSTRYLVKTKRVYLLSSYPVSSLTPGAAPALSDMQSWVALQNPQQINLAECMNYDDRGQLVFQQIYAVITADGQGAIEAHYSLLGDDRNEFGDCLTHYELQVSGQGPVTTTQTYDSLHRVLTHVDALNQTTSYVYLDAQRQTQTTRPNSRIELDTYDFLGNISDHQETIATLSKDSKYTADAVGRVSVLQDPDGIISYQLYDQQQRLVFEISALGVLTQHTYNQQYRFKKTTKYFNAITQAQLFPAGRPTPSTVPKAGDIVSALPSIINLQKDINTYIFLDACDRIRYKIDGENYVQELQYDTRGHVVATIRYAIALTAAQVTALTQGAAFPLVPDATKDQIHNFFYDADDLKVGRQDPLGCVVEYCFDIAGRMVQEIRYATPTALATTLTAARPTPDPVNDAHHYYFYDGKNQVILEVDAEGYITTIDHTPNGLVLAKCSYYNPVASSWYQNTQVPPALPVVSPEDRQVTYTYDALNRLTDSVSIAQKSQHNQYDVMGNVIFTRFYDAHYDPTDPRNIVDADKTRDKQGRYDGFDRISAEADPFIAQQLAVIATSGSVTPAQKTQQEEALWANSSLRYVYNASGLKLKSINTLNEITVYYYDQDRRLILTIDPQGAVVENTYSNFNQIAQTREYLTPIDPTKLSSLTGGYITADVLALLAPTDQDPIHQFAYNPRLQRTSSQDPEGYITTVDYDGFGQVAEENLPLNAQEPSLTIVHAYNVRGDEFSTVKQSSDKTITTQRQYKNLYAKVTQETDALGNSVNYVYTPKGNRKSITDPDNITQQTYTYDAFNRVFTVTNAFGDVTQYQYNQAQNTITVILPEANTQQVTQCNIFGEAIVKTNALGQSQTYAHASNGKVIKVTDALNRVTIDTLNTEGLLRLHQDSLGIQTEFIYNSSHYLTQKIVDLLGLRLTTTFLVDALGRQGAVTNPNGIVNKYTYDTRGWCTDVIEDNTGLQLLTHTAYNAQGTQTSVAQSDVGLTTQYLVLFQQDSLNRPVQKIVDPNTPKPSTGLQLTQTNRLDDNGKVVVHVDPKGQLTRLFYDACGNKRFKLEPTGALTEWLYDKNIRIAVRKRYITALTTLTDASTLNDVVTWTAANASIRDAATYFFYDHNGRERFTVTYVDVLGNLTAQGIVTETRYDAASRMVERVGYTASVNIAQCINTSYDALLALMNTLVDATHDRHTYYVLDGAGQQRFLFDPEQYAVEQVFDARGRIIQKIEYATFISNVQDLIKLPPDQITLPIDTVNDRITYHVFDVNDKPSYVVNPDKAVTYYQHDAMGNVLLRCRFAKTITVPSAYQDLITLLSGLTPDATQGDRIIRYKMDGLNRTAQITDALGQVEQWDHDILGNLWRQTDRANAVTQMEYDGAKRLTLKTSPVSTITTISRDTQGNLVANQVNRSVEEETEYDPNNNVTQVLKDANQPSVRTVNHTYDPSNHLSTSTFLSIPVDDNTKPADLANIPVITKDLAVTSGYNTMGLEIVKQDKSWWLWSFKIYDARGLLLYSVSSKGAVIKYIRNAFGELASQISYANVLTLDLSSFAETGLSLESLQGNLVPDPANDRTISYGRDRRGDVITISRDPVFYYYPNVAGQSEYGFAAPTVTYGKNAFRETYLLRYSRFPTHPELDYIKLCFRGCLGQDLAEVEGLQTALTADSLHETPMQYKVTRRTYDAAFNEEVSITEFANPLPKVSPSVTLAEIDQACTSSPLDRIKTRNYDLLGQLTKKSRVNVVRQQVSVDAQDKPQMQDTAALTLSKQYTYTPTGLKSSKTDEGGHVTYDYYDTRGFKIATTGIVNAQGDAVLQTYSIDAHGQQVVSTYYFNGTHVPALNVLPVPNNPDSANDQTNLYLFDNRGLIQIRQKPEGMQTFYTYTPSRNVAREYGPLTTWVENPTAGQPPLQATVIDEKQTTFDAGNSPIVKTILRNSKPNPNFTITMQYNAFGEETALGDGVGFPVFNHYDQAGYCFADNQAEKAARVQLFDLQGNPTAVLRIPDKTVVDISKLTPADLPSLVGSQYSDTQVERTALCIDPNNKVLQTTFPPFAVTSDDNPTPINLCFQVSNFYPELGKVSIAWPTLLSSYSLSFVIQQVDEVNPQILPVKTSNGMTGVDVSNFISDQYEYTLSFNTQDPHTQTNKTIYVATGELTIDTGIYAGSKRLVVTVKEGHVLYLMGNIAGITSIQLYQENSFINQFTPTPVPAQSALMFDFKYAEDKSRQLVLSGSYQVRGVQGSGVDAISKLNLNMNPRNLRQVVGNLRLLTTNAVDLMIQYLFYVLRDHRTPAIIHARDIQAGLVDDFPRINNTRSFKLLRLLVESPLVQAIDLGQGVREDAFDPLQQIALLFQAEPWLHIKKDSALYGSEAAREEYPLNSAIGGNLIPDRNKLRRWLSDVHSGINEYFRSADEALSAFVKLHALIERMALFSLICRDLEGLVESFGSRAWIEQGESILLDVQEGYRRLSREIRLGIQKLHTVAEEHYQEMTQQARAREPWLQNYSQANSVKSALLQVIAFAAKQIHQIPKIVAKSKAVPAVELPAEQRLTNVSRILTQFRRLFETAPVAEPSFTDIDEPSECSDLSLPFTLFTGSFPSKQPLAREIPFEAQLLVLGQHAQLKIWDTLPQDYQIYCVMQMNCTYEAATGTIVSPQVWISQETDLGHYTDGDGNVLVCNMEFEQPVVKILTMNLALVFLEDTQHPIVLYQSEVPVTSSPDFFNDALNAATNHTDLLYCLSIMNHDIIPSNDIITTYSFRPKDYAFIMTDDGNTGPELIYTDVTEGPNATQKTLTWLSFFFDVIVAGGFAGVFDITTLFPANYPFTWGTGSNLVTGLLCVTQGAAEFSSDLADVPMPMLQYTQNRSAYDVFGNKLSQEDADQQTTFYTYNDLNKKTQVTYPAVTVVDETGVANSIVTSKKMGFDLQGRPIGVIDENNHATIEMRDERGNVLQQILGDGTLAETNTYDLLNRQRTVTQPNGTQWILKRDRCNRLSSQTSSLGLVTTYGYDEKDHRSYQIDSAGNKTVFAYDEQDNIAIQVEPLGNFSVTVFDRNGEPLSKQDGNGKVVIYQRDYFGKVRVENLMNGSVRTSEYDQSEQLVVQQTQNTPAHDMIDYEQLSPNPWYPDPTPQDFYMLVHNPAPEQYLQFIYIGGLLTKILDIALDKISSYGFDVNRKRVQCSIKLGNGSIRVMTMTLDAKGRPLFVRDTNAQIYVGYDAKGNRRHIASTFTPCEDSSVVWTGDLWSTFDEADRVLIDEGSLVSGLIQIAKGIGKQFTYQQGLRRSETILFDDGSTSGKQIVNALTYDPDGRLLTTSGCDASGNPTSTTRVYFPNSNDLQQYNESVPTYVTTRNYTLDDNSNQTYGDAWRQDQGASKGTLEQSATLTYDLADNPVSQHLVLNTSQGYAKATLNVGYYCTDQYAEQSVSGQTFNPQGQSSNVTPAMMYFDSNGYTCGKADADNDGSEVTLFDATPEGWILGGKIFSVFNNVLSFSIQQSVFVDPDGNMFASYLTVQDPSNMNRAAMNIHSRNVPSSTGGHQAVSPLGPRQGEFLIADPVQSMVDAPIPCTAQDYQAMMHDNDASNYSRYIPNPMSSFPGITPSKYTVPDDNTNFVTVSLAVANSPDFAEVIARANGQSAGDLCAEGRVLTIPPLQINGNSITTNENLQQVLSVLIGSLSPHLEFAPKPVKGNSCAETILEAVISVVAVILAPQLAPVIFNSAALGIGVTAGVLDAGMQGMAKGAGLIQSFSWEAVFNAAFSAGFMKELQTGGLSFNKQLSAMQQVALYAGLTEVSTQLAMIAIKQQKGLDIRQVLASMSQAMIDQWVNTSIPHPIPAISDPTITAEQLVQRVGLDLVETAVGDAIMGSSLDMEMFMANELGSNLGGRIGNPVADYLNAQSKVPAPGTQQIKQDSLSPNDASYLRAAAAGQGQGWSPDYLEPYLGSDDPDDVFNYYLAMRDTSNSPAAQSNTRSQVTQNMLKQQANAARMQGIPVNYLQAMPDANQLDQFLNPAASNGVSRDNAMHFAGSSLNPADPHVAPDVWSQLQDINQVNAWAAQHPNNLLPAPNSMARTTGNAQASWFRRDYNAVSSFASNHWQDALSVAGGILMPTVDAAVTGATIAENHPQIALTVGVGVAAVAFLPEEITGGVIVAAGEGIAIGVRTVTPVVAKALQSAGFFSRSEKVAGEMERAASFVETPYGNAVQLESLTAQEARSKVAQGAWLYRAGKLGRSAGPEGQFWSLENPLNPGYAERYGIPTENAKFDFVEVAILKSNSTFVTRLAPGVGTNGGGGIEVVVNAGEPKLQYFHMPWEQPEYDSIEQRFVPKR